MIFLLVWRTNAFSAFLYPWGFLLLSLATAAVIAAAVNPASRLGGALGWGPLRWIGVRSYGIYLWQWPIIVLASPARGGFAWGRAVLEVTATVAAASLSWRFVEQPVRHGALVRLRRQLKGRVSVLGHRRPAAALGGAVAAGCACPRWPWPGFFRALAGRAPARCSRCCREPLAGTGPTVRSVANVAMRIPLFSLPIAAPTHSSCRSVVYLGDSTSEGEISTDYIPKASQRLPSQLARVGVRTLRPEISGARSTVETYEGHPNAATVAQQYARRGYRAAGSWRSAPTTWPMSIWAASRGWPGGSPE